MQAGIADMTSYLQTWYSQHMVMHGIIQTRGAVTDGVGQLMQAWIAEMSSYLKSLDSKHMVTAGTEGLPMIEPVGA